MFSASFTMPSFWCTLSAVIAANSIQSSIASPTVASWKKAVIRRCSWPSESRSFASLSDQLLSMLHPVSILMLLGISTIEPLGLWCTCVFWVETVSSGKNSYTPHFCQSKTCIVRISSWGMAASLVGTVYCPVWCCLQSVRTRSSTSCLWHGPCGQLYFIHTPKVNSKRCW